MDNKIIVSEEDGHPAWRLEEKIKWKKVETKGTLAYCSEGYCHIHQIDQINKEITVKLKHNKEIKTFSSLSVSIEIPLSLKIIQNMNYRNETFIIPCNSDAKALIAKIESQVTSENHLGIQVYFAGKSLDKTIETLEQLNIVPWSKILVIVSAGKSLVIKRFPTSYAGWGFYGKIDGIAFQVNKPVIILGFGIFRPDRNESSRTMQLIAKFIPENNAEGTPFEQRELIIEYNSDPEEKLYKFLFSKPFRAKANEVYCCVLDVQKGYSHYGTGGLATVIEETKNVEFTFQPCAGSKNGTSVQSGQIPEIYFC